MWENIIITLECVQPSLPFHENNPWSVLWPRPICPGYCDRNHDQMIIFEVDVMDKIDKLISTLTLNFNGPQISDRQ